MSRPRNSENVSFSSWGRSMKYFHSAGSGNRCAAEICIAYRSTGDIRYQIGGRDPEQLADRLAQLSNRLVMKMVRRSRDFLSRDGHAAELRAKFHNQRVTVTAHRTDEIARKNPRGPAQQRADRGHSCSPAKSMLANMGLRNAADFCRQQNAVQEGRSAPSRTKRHKWGAASTPGPDDRASLPRNRENERRLLFCIDIGERRFAKFLGVETRAHTGSVRWTISVMQGNKN